VQVARDLGINAGTLGNWVNADARRRGGDGVLSEDERAELARLRKENAELAMERGVLPPGCGGDLGAGAGPAGPGAGGGGHRPGPGAWPGVGAAARPGAGRAGGAGGAGVCPHASAGGRSSGPARAVGGPVAGAAGDRPAGRRG